MNFAKLLTRCALSAALVLAAGSAALAQQTEKATLMLNWYATGLHSPLILGQQKGFFKEEGVELEIQEGRGSGPTVQAVAANNVTIGFADLTTMMALASKGAPVISIGSALQRSPFAVISLKEKGIDTPEKVKGLTIATTAGDSPSQSWPLFLEKNGLKNSDFKTVSGDAKTKVNAVITGQADALLGFATDQGSQIEAATGKPITNMLFADFGVNSIGSSFIVNMQTVESNPELLRKFMRAATRSFEYATQHPDEAVDAVRSTYPNAGNKESLMTGLKIAIPLFKSKETETLRPLRVTKTQVEETVATMIAIGILKASDNDASKYYTDAFLP
ncbi:MULTISPECIES: ABC transporter substrate-binding protein [unclassified Sinorhizobium]|uniref:ABC transporter substrate-binding protein n=1 Tax=unclassified Sinorhizobium TaxID=2613772 RepID=UPI003526010C